MNTSRTDHTIERVKTTSNMSEENDQFIHENDQMNQTHQSKSSNSSMNTETSNKENTRIEKINEDILDKDILSYLLKTMPLI